MLLERLVVGKLQTNCYIVGCERTNDAMVIDPGDEAERVLQSVRSAGLEVTDIFLTHFHFDHILAAETLHKETKATLHIHKREANLLTHPPPIFRTFSPEVPHGLKADNLLHNGDALSVGKLSIRVLHTPGHSPGGISLWIPEENAVFCGDTLFREGLGRSDLPGGDHQTLIKNIRDKLLTLPEETQVYPGHGAPTTIAHEMRHNPWIASQE
ncbi:MAG: MBL fold metallo-hydrolase [Chloroflexota bacterium]|nr:MBL fold metallo-hydrolase [Chloroflexota bacterium]